MNAAPRRRNLTVKKIRPYSKINLEMSYLFTNFVESNDMTPFAKKVQK